jgi:hypothetical protein
MSATCPCAPLLQRSNSQRQTRPSRPSPASVAATNTTQRTPRRAQPTNASVASSTNATLASDDRVLAQPLNPERQTLTQCVYLSDVPASDASSNSGQRRAARVRRQTPWPASVVAKTRVYRMFLSEKHSHDFATSSDLRRNRK